MIEEKLRDCAAMLGINYFLRAHTPLIWQLCNDAQSQG